MAALWLTFAAGDCTAVAAGECTVVTIGANLTTATAGTSLLVFIYGDIGDYGLKMLVSAIITSLTYYSFRKLIRLFLAEYTLVAKLLLSQYLSFKRSILSFLDTMLLQLLVETPVFDLRVKETSSSRRLILFVMLSYDLVILIARLIS